MDIVSKRYSNKFMRDLFSEKTKYTTWRKLWIALADAEKECGLNITNEQIQEMTNNIENIDYNRVEEIEKETHHDVMAHLKHFGEVCPKSKGIMHLGATSCYITDNTDIIIYKKAFDFIHSQLILLLGILVVKCSNYKDLPIVAYTHYQPAQLTTLGKRLTVYANDVLEDVIDMNYFSQKFRMLGCRGAVGTEDSFMDLFDRDSQKIDKMNSYIAKSFGFNNLFFVSTQTYTRKFDSQIANLISGVAETMYHIANDIRLMQHDRIIFEPFGKSQVGSSAMPYKKNPMMCEKICSLTRHIINTCRDAKDNYTSQWLERTLDDSANRRIYIEEMLTLTSYVIDKMQEILCDFVVNEKKIKSDVEHHLPLVSTERIMMEIVKQGGDRQSAHEFIRDRVTKIENYYDEGFVDNLFEDIREKFKIDIKITPEDCTKRCVEQVEIFTQMVEYLITKGVIK